MMDETILERRLATLEQEVKELKLRSKNSSNSANWLNQLIGSISDEAAFLEALEYGRFFRQSDKPVDESEASA
jgi:hypothetical protein